LGTLEIFADNASFLFESIFGVWVQDRASAMLHGGTLSFKLGFLLFLVLSNILSIKVSHVLVSTFDSLKLLKHSSIWNAVANAVPG